jgi:hypothetical protein
VKGRMFLWRCSYCNIQLAEQTGKFIEQVSTWFSIMNSYSVAHSEHVRKPYGLFFENQNNSLNGIYETFKSVKCHGKNVLQTFQKSLLTSVKSLQQLFIEIRAKYDSKHILTHRVNQNCIEIFFFASKYEKWEGYMIILLHYNQYIELD